MDEGPTAERLRHAGKEFYITVGRARSQQRTTMLDDALGKALVKQIIQPDEYEGLRKYALHWLAGGLAGHLSTIDLNRILAFDATSMGGLARNERQLYHRQVYHQARDRLGTRAAFVADQVACQDNSITFVGLAWTRKGDRDPQGCRLQACEILGRVDPFPLTQGLNGCRFRYLVML